ncbi:hypothetical protein [Endozoicomonas sp. YOMI1]|uniref:hypothetical protein n=1 Tax=Endozoicomonas sp. YOMI1 TaxID=2828739 RepID=UPI0021486F11|nr:hypothetical protein [Endozoicomonas sp. YOMI1]
MKSSQCDAAQVPFSQGALQEVRSGAAEKKQALDPEMLRQLSRVKKQIIDLTGVHGQIPHEEWLRFKLGALYIQENILTRMLHGISSHDAALSKFHSLGDLIPHGPMGGALRKVLDLWWLSGNDKYFPESAVDSFFKLQLASRHLQEAFKLLNSSSSGSADSESFCEVSDSKEFSDRIRPIVEKGRFNLTRLDKIVVIFHHLYQEFNSDGYTGLVNITNIDILENYYNELLLETEFSCYEKEIAYFAFLQSLGLFYNKLALECTVLGLGYPAGKSTELKLAPLQQTITYNNILHKMMVANINSGIFRVADYWVLSLFSSGFLMNYRWKSSDRALLTALSSALLISPKQESEIALVKFDCFAIAEILEDVGVFESVADNASKYNTFALLTMLWNDLGFSRWPYSTTLNPEKALEYLEFIHAEINDHKNKFAEIVKQSMDAAYKLNLLAQGSTKMAKLCSERIALFYFLSGDPGKASELLRFAKRNSKTLYFGLSMASKGKYELAIQFLEKDSAKDVCIKALLGILNEKLASSKVDSGEKYQLLRKAELNYRSVISSRPEMNKYFAMLLERQGDLPGAVKQWKAYRCFLHGQAKQNNIRSVRFKIPMEIKLVGEKILELESKLEKNKSGKNAELLLGGSKSSRKDAEEKKPESKTARKRKGKKNSQPAVYSRLACQETCKEKKPADIQTEKRGSNQVPDLEPELNVNSGSECEGQTDHQQQSLIEKQGLPVTGKPEPVRLTVNQGVKIPVDFSMTEVERHWACSRVFRNNLTNRLLLLDVGRDDYDGVLAIIDHYVVRVKNPVAQLHFIQNREWLLRCKSFDNRALYAQCCRTGQSIQALKAELRLSILQCVREQVASVFQHAFQCPPSSIWFSNPDLLKEDIKCLMHHVHPEFCVQFGAQFSTAAHVMKDIHWEFTCQKGKDQMCRSLYGHYPGDYSNLADRFYNFRNFIDPQHVSDII